MMQQRWTKWKDDNGTYIVPYYFSKSFPGTEENIHTINSHINWFNKASFHKIIFTKFRFLIGGEVQPISIILKTILRNLINVSSSKKLIILIFDTTQKLESLMVMDAGVISVCKILLSSKLFFRNLIFWRKNISIPTYN